VRFLRAKDWLKDAASFYKNVCACSECRATLAGDISRFVEFGRGKVKSVSRGASIVRIEYPTTATKLHCLRHYLQRKAMEYQFAATATRDQILTDLKRGRDEFARVLGLDGVGRLQLWEDTLSPRA